MMIRDGDWLFDDEEVHQRMIKNFRRLKELGINEKQFEEMTRQKAIQEVVDGKCDVLEAARREIIMVSLFKELETT